MGRPLRDLQLVNATVDASGADGHFGIVPFRGDDDSHPVLNDPDDRMVMTFDLGESDTNVDNFYTGTYPDTTNTGDGVGHFGQKTPEGASVNVKVTTKSGATTSEQLTVPETVSGSSAVQL